MAREVLAVDDDKKIVNLVSLYLRSEGFQVTEAFDGPTALDLALKNPYDLIILDLMLPGIDGIDICRTLRTQTKVPIIMLTARSTEDDKLVGLDLGADDYVTKPFSPRELMARVRAVLRRAADEEEQPDKVTYGPLEMNFLQREVRLKGYPVNLTPNEYRLLEAMVKEPGRTFNREELIEKAFGFDYDGLERTVDVHIKNLRKKIEPEADHFHFIVTVSGFGYRFDGGTQE